MYEKLIIVTGSTGGIGLNVVNECIESGLNVIALYRNKEKTKKMISSNRLKKVYIDFSDENEDEELIKLLDTLNPKKMIVIHTSFSIEPIKKIGSFNKEEIETNIHSNVVGPIEFFNNLINWTNMHHSKISIINLDSGARKYALSGWGLYSSAKAYLFSFLNTVSYEYGHVNVVNYDPGVVDTTMQESIRASSKEVFDRVDEFERYEKDGDLVSPNYIAKEILRLIDGV